MTLSSFQTEILDGLIEQENDLSKPSVTIGSNTYTCIPSVSMFQRQLEAGGYINARLLTAVIRMVSYTFPSTTGTSIVTTLPAPQQKLTYNIDGNIYRIENVKVHPSLMYLTIQAVGEYRGI